MSGDLGRAVRQHEAALEEATTRGLRDAEAHALNGLGDMRSDRGDAELAREHWRRALGILESLELPEAATVRAKLDE